MPETVVSWAGSPAGCTFPNATVMLKEYNKRVLKPGHLAEHRLEELPRDGKMAAQDKEKEGGRGSRTAKLSTPLRFFRPLEKIFLMWFGRRCGFVEP